MNKNLCNLLIEFNKALITEKHEIIKINALRILLLDSCLSHEILRLFNAQDSVVDRSEACTIETKFIRTYFVGIGNRTGLDFSLCKSSSHVCFTRIVLVPLFFVHHPIEYLIFYESCNFEKEINNNKWYIAVYLMDYYFFLIVCFKNRFLPTLFYLIQAISFYIVTIPLQCGYSLVS